MSTITLSTQNAGMTNRFASILALPTVDTEYDVLSAGTIEVRQSVVVMSKSEARFSNPIDQMAWEAYKKIESRYREANRRLAE